METQNQEIKTDNTAEVIAAAVTEAVTKIEEAEKAEEQQEKIEQLTVAVDILTMEQQWKNDSDNWQWQTINELQTNQQTHSETLITIQEMIQSLTESQATIMGQLQALTVMENKEQTPEPPPQNAVAEDQQEPEPTAPAAETPPQAVAKKRKWF